MGLELGKVYTDRDLPAFKTPEQIEEEKLTEDLDDILKMKPKVGDYFRTQKLFGKIVKIDSWKGTKLIYVDPKSGMPSGYKGGTLVGYDIESVQPSFRNKNMERNVGKPIWTQDKKYWKKK